MPELSIPLDDMAELITPTRAIQGREAEVDPDAGSNPSDDKAIDAIQETPDDLTRTEVLNVIRDFDVDQQAELVALLWLGRGDAEPAEWEETVKLAADRRDVPTERYLLSQPLVAEYWAEGLERLGVGVEKAEVQRVK